MTNVTSVRSDKMNLISLTSLKKTLVLTVLLQSVVSQDYSDEETVNDNLYDTKNFVNVNSNAVLRKLFSESRFNTKIIKTIGNPNDVVNHYEDITVLDENGQLKNLKLKAAKVPESLKNSVKNYVKVPTMEVASDSDSTKVNSNGDDSGNSDKLSDSETKVEVSGNKSKFFDEIGCKYIPTHYTLCLGVTFFQTSFLPLLGLRELFCMH